MAQCFRFLTIAVLLWVACHSAQGVERTRDTYGYDLMFNDAHSSSSYSLLRNDVVRQRLKVKRGQSSPLLHVHLPIQLRARKGQVCRVEVEEYQPLFSMVGHLEPKKFDCTFSDGDVIYYHSGNPLVKHDHVQVTIFFFRQNNSVVQTVDIMVDVEDDVERFDNALTRASQNDGQKSTTPRIQILSKLNVTGLESTTVSLSAEIMRIFYNVKTEECRLSYTSPDYGIYDSLQENQTETTLVTTSGSFVPRLGQPLAAGDAVGGVHRWPLFGRLVAFNRSTVRAFDQDCHEALLQGYRYMHRKANSPGTDFIPVQVTITRNFPNGSRNLIIRTGVFLEVNIIHGQPLKAPVAKVFRQVNVSHIGGSLSVLPRDSISVSQDTSCGVEYLDVNMTRMQGPLQAQIVNLRDPTRPVTNFRLLDLRLGLIALQLLNYAESQNKLFVITLTLVNPFFQVSLPVDLRIVTVLEQVIPVSKGSRSMPHFQVFSLPLFTYTGATSLIQKHNIQVVGYIDESVVQYIVQPWSLIGSYSSVSSIGQYSSLTPKSRGFLKLDGVAVENLRFGPPHVSNMRVTYSHTGQHEPTIERIPLRVAVTNSKRLRKKRRSRKPRQIGTKNRGPFKRSRRGRGRQRRARSILSQQHLELSIRIVRLHEQVNNGALQSGVILSLPAYSFICLTAEQLLTPEALRASRADIVNLIFSIKKPPDQGFIVRKAALPELTESQTSGTQSRYDFHEYGIGYRESQHHRTTLEVTEFTLADLERGDMCYFNQRRQRMTDLIGLKQLGRKDLPVVYVTIAIEPQLNIILEEKMNPNVYLRVRETAPQVIITPLHLNYKLRDLGKKFGASSLSNATTFGPEQIIYLVTGQPRFANTNLSGVPSSEVAHDAGRLVSLKAVTASTHVGDMNLQPTLSTSLKQLEAPSVVQFTQQQINMADMVYIPPVQDVGMNDKNVVMEYSVIGPGGLRLDNRLLKIVVVAEDNQAPKIKVVRSLTLQRDGELTLNNQFLFMTDYDTPKAKLIAWFERLPRFGRILLSAVNSTSREITTITQGQNIPVVLFEEGKVRYRQTGVNVKLDDFIITVTDGKHSSQPLRVPLHIRPRVLNENKLNQLVNNSVSLGENATVHLDSSMFPLDIESVQTAEKTPQYFLVVLPTKGKLILNDGSPKVSQFSLDDVERGRLAYRHGPSEIGPKPVFDFARIWDFNAGKTFSLNFTIMPINSHPPVINVSSTIQVKEGGRALIDQYTLIASDPDTADEDLQLQVVHPPRWGHIGIADRSMKLNDLASSDDVNHTLPQLTKSLTFSMQLLRENRVFYRNSLHADGKESVNDMFTIRAYDGSFHSTQTVEVHVSIQPINDEIPRVRLLKYFTVTTGSQRVLTPYLFAVSDQDVPRDLLQIQFIQLPKFGNLTVFWQHGEKYVITKDSPPITESYLSMMNLLYVQNPAALPLSSTSTGQHGEIQNFLVTDRFGVSVSDGQHSVEKHSEVLIRPPNRFPPEMYTDLSQSAEIVLDGIAWTRLDKVPGGLVMVDRDTSDDDLVLTIEEAPKLGVLQRLPRLSSVGGVNVLDLIEEAWDFEEAAVEDDPKELKRLAQAGSVGGPKSAKTLQVGDRFTKRQIETDRIVYLYKGPYQEESVRDSCVLRLSDGEYETGAVHVRFRIRQASATVGVQSPDYQPVEQADEYPRQLEYSDQGRQDASTTPDHRIKQDYEETQQYDITNLKAITHAMPEIDMCLDRYTFLQASNLPIEELLGLENVALRNEINFTLFNSSLVESFIFGECGVFFRAAHPNYNLSRFSLEDIINLQVAISAQNCIGHLDQILPVYAKMDSKLNNESLYLKIPIRITKKCRDLPVLTHSNPISILPGADTVLTAKHLHVSDSDTDPTRVIYIVDDEMTPQLGALQHETGVVLKFFTQYQIDSNQIIYRAYTNITEDSTRDELINLHLFDAGEFTNLDDGGLVYFEALNMLRVYGPMESNPYIERMQYVIDPAFKTISIKPISFKVHVQQEFFDADESSELIPLVLVPPEPSALETILPGHIGFRLTSAHLYVRKLDAVYRVLDDMINVYNIWLNQSVGIFTQMDLNRRRIAVLVTGDRIGQKFGKPTPERLHLEDKTHHTLEVEVYSPSDPKRRHNVSLNLHWARIGFQRSIFRVCSERRLLRVNVERYGSWPVIQNQSADVYIGFTSGSAIEGKDFSLHSQKLLLFGPGDSRNVVLIRLHPRNPSLKRQDFTVSLKSPTGALLGKHRQARVVMRNGARCRKHRYTPSNRQENPVKRDLAMQRTHFSDRMPSDDNGIRNSPYFINTGLASMRNINPSAGLSLNEWLATNVLPDSQSLSASYQDFLRGIEGQRCQHGWIYHGDRCYQGFPEQAFTWDEAREQCEYQEAFLMSINCQEDAKWLKDTFGLNKEHWIGLHQRWPGAEWVWHNLERTSYTNWYDGFPVQTGWDFSGSHRTSSGTPFDRNSRWGPRACVVITEPKLQWRNRPCSEPLRASFVCMKNPEV